MHKNVVRAPLSHKNVGSTSGSTVRPMLAIGVVFLLKFVVVLQLRDHPLLQPDAGLDTTAYVDLARQVLAGNLGLGPGLYFVSPLYIYFLAGALATFRSFTAVRILQIALGTASVAGIFLMTRIWFTERAAWCAAVLAAATGLFTFYESIILQASIDAFLTSAALLTLTLGLRRPARGWLLLSGIVFGIGALNRPNVPLAVAGITGALLLTRRVRPAVVLLAGLLAGMAPVVIRNLVVSHQWSLVSSHGGLNFYIGNSEAATGFFHPIPGITPNIVGQAEDARRVAERATGHALTDSETSDYFFRLAWSWIAKHPAEAASLFARKLGFVFSAAHVALPHSYPFYAYDAATALRLLFIGPWLLLPLGVIGLVFAAPPTGRSDYFVWAAFVPGYAIGVAAFFVAERYRLPMLVPLCAGAGAAIDRAARLVAEKRFAAVALPAVAFVAASAAANWPHGLHDGRWEEELRMVQRMVMEGRFEDAERWVQKGIPHEPRSGATDFAVGSQLLMAQQPTAALNHLERAQANDPGRPEIEYALGQALLANGHAVEAIPHLRRGFDAGIEIPQGGYDLALALQKTGDTEAALEVVRRIRPVENDAEAWLRVGRLAVELRGPDVAEQFFRRAVVIRPENAGGHQQLGLNLLVLHRYEEAASELGEAVRLNPRDADGLSRLAYCELELGRSTDARTHAEAALAVNPNDPLASQLLSVLR